MAGVGWKGGKCVTTTDAGNIIAHCDKETRKRVNHSNPHIDKSKTDTNLSLFDLSADEVKQKLADRIDELTNGKGPRKNQPVAHFLSVAVPAWLDKKDEQQFIEGVYHTIGSVIGEPNILEMWLHNDEIHDYVDPDTLEKKESLRNIHMLCTPAVDFQIKQCLTDEEKAIRKEEKAAAKAAGKKWNAKKMSSVQPKKRRIDTPNIYHLNHEKFYSMENVDKVNFAMDAYCKETYGKPYMLGGQGRDLTVEEAKRLSKQAEVLYKVKKAAEDEKAEYEQKNKTLTNKIQEAAELIADYEQKKEDQEKADAEIKRKSKKISDDTDTLNNALADLANTYNKPLPLLGTVTDYVNIIKKAREEEQEEAKKERKKAKDDAAEIRRQANADAETTRNQANAELAAARSTIDQAKQDITNAKAIIAVKEDADKYAQQRREDAEAYYRIAARQCKTQGMVDLIKRSYNLITPFANQLSQDDYDTYTALSFYFKEGREDLKATIDKSATPPFTQAQINEINEANERHKQAEDKMDAAIESMKFEQQATSGNIDITPPHRKPYRKN